MILLLMHVEVEGVEYLLVKMGKESSSIKINIF